MINLIPKLLPVGADAGNKLIQSYSVTHAAVHDSQVFDVLLDHATDADGNKRAVYADSAYRSEAQEQRLVEADMANQVCEKGTRGKPLTEEQKLSNRTKSKVKARVEHVPSTSSGQALAHRRQWVDIWCAPLVCSELKSKFGLMNLVYNMMRLVQLIKRDSNVTKRELMNHHREGVPEVA